MAWNIGQEWTQQEIDLLKQHYETDTKENILKLFPNRTWSSIHQYAYRNLQLSRKQFGGAYSRNGIATKKWNSEEEDIIYNMLSTHTVQQIADFFQVSYSQMEDKIHKMGLSRKGFSGESWTAEEDLILQKHYSFAPKSYLQEQLYNRKWNPILQRGKKVFHLERLARDTTYLEYRVFDEWNEQTAYIFGFILADGYIKSKDYGGEHNILRISVHSRDVDIIYKIAAVLKYRGNITHFIVDRDKVRMKKDTPESSIAVHNKWLINQLAVKGMTMLDKSNTVVFPANVPNQYIRHLIRGIIDGDGWASAKQIHDHDTFIIGVCGTYDIVSKIKENLPIDCSDIAIYQMTKTCFRWNIQGGRAFKIAEWLYKDATIYLDRKYNEYCQAKQKYAPSSEQSGEDTQ